MLPGAFFMGAPMMTRKPDRAKPDPKTRAKARRAYRMLAENATKTNAPPVLDSKGRPRKNRFFVKA